MGGKNSKNKKTGDRSITIAILGLDNAGKTTLAKVLEKTPVEYVAPTIGFAQYDVNHNGEKIKLYDLGGLKSFRDAWRHYYDDPYGFIYVIDSSEENRLDENREVLRQLLQEDKIQNKPILILANKQDRREALGKNEILGHLQIKQILNDNRTLFRLELCTATVTALNGGNARIDPAIQRGFDWLIKTIYENYDPLHKRVQNDIRRRNEAEQKAQHERHANVLKIREERAKQEGGETDDDDDHHPTTNGFVPIQHPIHNVEENSTFSTDLNDVVTTRL